MIAKLIYKWQDFLKEKSHKQIFIYTLIFTLVNVLFFTWFMRLNEHRRGIHFSEPLLEYILPVTDLTWYIFTLTYISIAIGVAIFIKHPLNFLKVLQAYNLLLIFRFLSISILPLEPPANIIPMKDPIIETIAAYDGFIFKDLFFSGHTATLFLMGLMIKNNYLKILFFAVTFTVALMLIKQQVHYSIDVIAAPLFAYMCYYLIEKFWKGKELFQASASKN